MRRLLGVAALWGLWALSGCGQNDPAGASLPAQPPPSAAPAEKLVSQPVATLPAGQSGPEEVSSTQRGEVAFNAREHRLRVSHDGRADEYRTAPIGRDLSAAEQQVLLGPLSNVLRYPTERTTRVGGTGVWELRPNGNEFLAVTFHTRENVAAADGFYAARLAAGPVHFERLAVPFGKDPLVLYSGGMASQRYRVLIAPESGGARIEVTQLRIAGTEPQEYETGQGLLRPWAAAAATTKPPTASDA